MKKLFEIVFLISIANWIIGCWLAYTFPNESWRIMSARTGYTVDILAIILLVKCMQKYKKITRGQALKTFCGGFFLLCGYIYYQFYGMHPYISAISNRTFDLASAAICLALIDFLDEK